MSQVSMTRESTQRHAYPVLRAPRRSARPVPRAASPSATMSASCKPVNGSVDGLASTGASAVWSAISTSVGAPPSWLTFVVLPWPPPPAFERPSSEPPPCPAAGSFCEGLGTGPGRSPPPALAGFLERACAGGARGGAPGGLGGGPPGGGGAPPLRGRARG